MDELEERGIPIEPSLEAANVDEEIHEEKYEQSYEETFDFNHIPFEIWGIIFKHLNGRDLSSAAMVCRTWLESANSEKRLRGPFCFLEKIKLSLTDVERLSIDYTQLNQLTIKPSIGFFFLDSTALNNNVKGPIREILPTNCKIIILFTHDVHLNGENYFISSYFHSDNICGSMVCVLLPQIPEVRLSMVTVTNTISEEDRYIEYTQMIEGASRENHESSICLMLFYNHNGSRIGSEMATIAKSKLGNNERLVFIYSGVKYLQTNNETVSLLEPYCVALLIIGPIQTWSIVLEEEQDCQTMELIKEKLKLFKEQVKLQKHSMGFMFSSLSSRIILEDNIRIQFKELFPNVPLIGYYSNDFERDITICTECVFPRHKKRHNNSITFMILTYDICEEKTLWPLVL